MNVTVVYRRDGTRLEGRAADAALIEDARKAPPSKPTTRKGLRGIRPRPAVVQDYLDDRRR